MDIRASTKWTWVNHASKYKMQNYVLLEDNRENLIDLGLGKNFLYTTLKGSSWKKITDKLDYIKIQKCLLCKRHCFFCRNNEMKRCATE